MIDHSIDERIRKLNDEVRQFLGVPKTLTNEEKTTPEKLSKMFSLTPHQAKAWLRKEPDFSSDASYHEPQNRRKVTRTALIYI